MCEKVIVGRHRRQMCNWLELITYLSNSYKALFCIYVISWKGPFYFPHLVILAAGAEQRKNPQKCRFWLVNILQLAPKHWSALKLFELKYCAFISFTIFLSLRAKADFVHGFQSSSWISSWARFNLNNLCIRIMLERYGIH